MSLLRALSTVGGFTMISRITGFVRDILIAALLGASTAADAFLVAFKLPNMFRRLFAEGAFSAGFVPLFTQLYERNKLEAKTFADEAFTALALVLFGFCAVMMAAMPWFIFVIAPGFDEVEGKIVLAQELAQIAFPYLFFISLVALQAGVLNALNRFGAAAATPILLNLTLITALLGFTGRGVATEYVLATAVSVAGVIQFLWLSVHCKRAGVFPRFTRPKLSPAVKDLLTRMLPLTFGVGIYQVNLLVDTILASFVANGAVTWLYLADRVTQLPLGVVGVAVGTALLPLVSRQIEAGESDAARESQANALLFCLILTVPAAAGLMTLAEPVAATLYERGAFLASDRIAVAGAIAAYSVGLPAFVLIKALAPGFFARGDTATPVKVAAVSLVVNIILNIVLMQILGHVGIALATAIASWINAGLLAMLLHRRGHLGVDGAWVRRVSACVLAAVLMAGLVWGGNALAAQAGFAPFGLLDGPAEDETTRFGLLIALIILGAVSYAIAGRLFGVATLSDIKIWWRKPTTPAANH